MNIKNSFDFCFWFLLSTLTNLISKLVLNHFFLPTLTNLKLLCCKLMLSEFWFWISNFNGVDHVGSPPLIYLIKHDWFDIVASIFVDGMNFNFTILHVINFCWWREFQFDSLIKIHFMYQAVPAFVSLLIFHDVEK